MNKLNFKFAVVVTLLLIAGLASGAMAGDLRLPVPHHSLYQQVLFGLFEKKEPPKPAAPPEHPIHDEKSFTELTKPYGLMPYSKAELEFEILIPKDWEVAETMDATPESAQQILSRIAEYRSPMFGTMQASCFIDALKLEHEISAKYWLKNYILSSGFTPEGEVEGKDVKNASGYYIRTGDPGAPSTLEYVTGSITGTWILLATCQVPLPLRNYLKFLQKRVVESFKILYPKDDPIEDGKIFTLVDSIKFGYPHSWEVDATDFKDMNRLSVHLKNQGKAKTIDGYIRIIAVRRSRSTDLVTEVAEQRKYFDETMKLKIMKLDTSTKGPVYDRFLFNRFEIYDAMSKKSTSATGVVQEIQMQAMGDKEWYVFAYLFTPKEATNLYQWARNTQTFQEILKSVK